MGVPNKRKTAWDIFFLLFSSQVFLSFLWITCCSRLNPLSCFSCRYSAQGYSSRLNTFSSSELKWHGMPLGDADADNRSVMMAKRFVMANIGDESGKCDWKPASKSLLDH